MKASQAGQIAPDADANPRSDEREVEKSLDLEA